MHNVLDPESGLGEGHVSSSSPSEEPVSVVVGELVSVEVGEPVSVEVRELGSVEVDEPVSVGVERPRLEERGDTYSFRGGRYCGNRRQ